MKRTWLAAALIALAPTGSALADQTMGRELYALIESLPEYCPGVDKRFGITGAVEYDASAEGEMTRLRAAKQKWFTAFRQGGDRATVCDVMMQRFGPGGDPHLFVFD